MLRVVCPVLLEFFSTLFANFDDGWLLAEVGTVSTADDDPLVVPGAYFVLREAFEDGTACLLEG